MEKTMCTEEYKTLRNEILQYLQNYQNIRNMMYALSLTMIGFFINKNVDALYFLSPSVIIIPSYLATINYWHCATKISTYIRVFYEKDDKNMKWETMSVEFEKNNSKITKINTQLVPYIAMQSFCVLLYFINIDYTDCYKCDIIVGIIFILVSIYIFNKYKKDRADDFVEYWEKMKESM